MKIASEATEKTTKKIKMDCCFYSFGNYFNAKWPFYSIIHIESAYVFIFISDCVEAFNEWVYSVCGHVWMNMCMTESVDRIHLFYSHLWSNRGTEGGTTVDKFISHIVFLSFTRSKLKVHQAFKGFLILFFLYFWILFFALVRTFLSGAIRIWRLSFILTLVVVVCSWTPLCGRIHFILKQKQTIAEYIQVSRKGLSSRAKKSKWNKKPRKNECR